MTAKQLGSPAAPAGWVIGQRFYTGPILPLRLLATTDCIDGHEDSPRFSLLLFAHGQVRIRLQKRNATASHALHLCAPCLLLAGEDWQISWPNSPGIRLTGATFSPEIINSALDIALLRTGQYAGTAIHDADSLLPFLADRPQLRTLSQESTQLLSRLFERMQALSRNQDDAHWPCKTRASLMEILFHVCYGLAEPASQDTHRLDEAIDFVHAHFADTALSLEMLAARFASNRTTLNRHFRLRTGQTMRAHMIALRMQLAAQLLRDTLLPVGQIATMVGYEDISHFGRMFGRENGQSPLAYRQQHNWMLPQAI